MDSLRQDIRSMKHSLPDGTSLIKREKSNKCFRPFGKTLFILLIKIKPLTPEMRNRKLIFLASAF